MLTDLEILRDIDRRIADLQNTTDRALGSIRSEFRQFRTERHYLLSGLRRDMREISDRLEILEEKASKPLVDWSSIVANIWFKLGLLAALASGNPVLIEWARTALTK